MRSSLVMSLIGAASMALALLAGCGDDDAKPASSGAGQSCVRTADCAEGLSCIANVCYKTAPPTGGEGGDNTVTPPGPVLGSEGESCTSRKDCTAPLGCFNNRCTSTESTGDAGSTGNASSGIALGARGESCRVNGDCTKGLVCVPSTTVGTGVCDLAEFGLEPTGKSCIGECLTPADCCQLPLALHTTVPSITSCEDIAAAIKADAIDCDAPTTPSGKLWCFEQATYCECAKNTWACTANSCVYGPACVVAAGPDVPTGCPSYSRNRSLLGLTCNADTLKCVGATAPPGCTTDKSCETKPVFDRQIQGDVCGAGECICYSGNKQCYKTCARDIDCGANQVCDTAKTKLCVPTDDCTNDAQCALDSGNVNSKCNSGHCAIACTVDRDCSRIGLGGNNPGFFNGYVCGADGFCASIAGDCTDDSECPLSAGGLKDFCIDRPETPAGGVHSSGITD